MQAQALKDSPVADGVKSVVDRRGATGRRGEVVRAAARLFSERGYHGTSMQHLGEALGLLRGSLYAHIGSKEELLFEVVNEGAERFLARGAAALETGGPAATRLRGLLVAHIETAIEHMDAATVFLNEWRYLSDERRSLIVDKRHRYESMMRTVIEEGMRAGEFRPDLDVPLAARLVLSAGNWTYSWYSPGGDLSPTQIAEMYADMLVKGFESRAREGVSVDKGVDG
jgi:TetR/AcrR family transcriptional regulator, cholesterol catabolism regulator